VPNRQPNLLSRIGATASNSIFGGVIAFKPKSLDMPRVISISTLEPGTVQESVTANAENGSSAKRILEIDKELQKGKWVRIQREDRDNVYETHAVWLQTPYLPLKIRLAVDMLVSRLPTSMT